MPTDTIQHTPFINLFPAFAFVAHCFHINAIRAQPNRHFTACRFLASLSFSVVIRGNGGGGVGGCSYFLNAVELFEILSIEMEFMRGSIAHPFSCCFWFAVMHVVFYQGAWCKRFSAFSSILTHWEHGSILPCENGTRECVCVIFVLLFLSAWLFPQLGHQMFRIRKTISSLLRLVYIISLKMSLAFCQRGVWVRMQSWLQRMEFQIFTWAFLVPTAIHWTTYFRPKILSLSLSSQFGTLLNRLSRNALATSANHVNRS